MDSSVAVGKDPVYDRGYHAERHANLIADDEYFWARAKASAELYLTHSEQQKRVFEYGCGIGQGIAALPNAAGWDISAEARENCRRRKLQVFDSLELVPKRSWDIVLCRHVLEHLENPLEHLKIMRELAAESGMLLLVLPREKHYESPFEPDLNQHLYCWNFRTINNLLARSGWKPYANRCEYVLGYRALLPVKRIVGHAAYFQATRLIGRLKQNGELIVHAALKGA